MILLATDNALAVRNLNHQITILVILKRAIPGIDIPAESGSPDVAATNDYDIYSDECLQDSV